MELQWVKKEETDQEGGVVGKRICCQPILMMSLISCTHIGEGNNWLLQIFICLLKSMCGIWTHACTHTQTHIQTYTHVKREKWGWGETVIVSVSLPVANQPFCFCKLHCWDSKPGHPVCLVTILSVNSSSAPTIIIVRKKLNSTMGTQSASWETLCRWRQQPFPLLHEGRKNSELFQLSRIL